MPTQINANYSANFQKFVDFANRAYATKGANTVARFSGMPSGDYQGTFASLWRTSEMKAANDQVRDLFRKTVADMFGGERNIPDIVRDNMKLEDFGQGKPLTARRINLVKTAIDIVGGGKPAGDGLHRLGGGGRRARPLQQGAPALRLRRTLREERRFVQGRP